MKALGIVRHIDDLGRVVIPMEVRKVKGWESGQAIEMLATNEGLLIRPYAIDLEKEEVIESINAALDVTDNATVREILSGALKFIKKQ